MILSVILEIPLSHFAPVSVILSQYSAIFVISSDILEISLAIFVISSCILEISLSHSYRLCQRRWIVVQLDASIDR
jgi:hypothetical protein